VVSCKYVQPHIIKKIIIDADKTFNNIESFLELPRDKFYLVTIKQIDLTDFAVLSVENVTENGGFYTLH
jgi:hypothetical protein